MPQRKVYANRAEQQRAYRERQQDSIALLTAENKRLRTLLDLRDMPMNIPDVHARILNEMTEDLADLAVGDPFDPDSAGSTDDEQFYPLMEAPAFVVVPVVFCTRWGDEIDRAEYTVAVGADGKTEPIRLDHMARMS